MEILSNVKLMLGLAEDTERDDLLNLIIEGASKRLLAYLPTGTDEVPSELEYIVLELAIARFNRIGNENMSSYTQEGESMSFNSDDMAPYLKDIQSWCERQESNIEGVVRFI